METCFIQNKSCTRSKGRPLCKLIISAAIAYPAEWTEGMEPYYPVNDEKNQELYKKYAELAGKEENVIFGGRLAEYRYYDMDKVIESAFSCVKKEFGNE